MDDIQDAFLRYASEPTLERFLELRALVAQSAAYDPNNDHRFDAEKLLDNREYEAALRLLEGDMPNAFLTPLLHFLIAIAAGKLGDEKRARLENLVGTVLLNAILKTGDGSQARPFLVSAVTDETDVLVRLNKKRKKQNLVASGNAMLDQIECDDGTEVWFDVSMPFARRKALNEALFGPEEITPDENGVVASYTSQTAEPTPPAPEPAPQTSPVQMPSIEEPPAAKKSPWWKFGRS